MDAVDRISIALRGKWLGFEYMGKLEPRVIEAVIDGDTTEASILLSTGVEDDGVDIENVTLEDYTFFPSRDVCLEFCDQQNALGKSVDDEGSGDEAEQ